MTKFYSITGTVAFVTLMGSTSAFADVSATEAWNEWRGYLTAMGQTLNADEALSGDTLTVSNVSVVAPTQENQPTVTVNYGTLTFQETGDGRVTISFPDSINLNVEKEGDLKIVLKAAFEGQSIIASGAANDVTYDMSADRIDISLVELTAKGKPVDNDHANGFVTIKGLSGTSHMVTGDMRQAASNSTIESVDYQINFTSPKNGADTFSLVGGLQSLSSNASYIMPLMMDMQDFPAMLAAGMDMKGAISWKDGGMRFSLVDKGKPTEITSESTGGSLSFLMNAQTLGYGMGATGVKTNVSVPDLPFPVDYEIGEFAFDLTTPIQKSDNPADFSALLKLADFNTSDMIWSLGDPTGALPHDAATFIVDLSGKAQMLVDLMDPEAMAMGDQPGLLHALTLKALQLKIAGADLTGNGAFTFDNNDMETFPDFPLPEGALDLKLVGGNGLLDKLIQMGLVQEDQAMGARMMMGLFAQPGEGEDTLTSKIEVKDGGHVYANGQRLK